MTDIDPDLVARVRQLEVSVEIQETILAVIQADCIEADRLKDSVGRLSLDATALGEALLQVDRNQQKMTQLGRQLSIVDQEKASKGEVDAKVKVAGKQRHRLAVRSLVVGGLVTFVLGGLLAFTINSDYQACEQRQTRVDIQVNAFQEIADLAQGSSAQPRILQLAEDLEDSKVNCAMLYPIHFGN